LLLMLLPVQAEATVTVSTLAGSGTQGFADIPGVGAKFNSPRDVAVDSTGTVYVADGGNNRIRKILPNGTVSTLAGSGTAGFADGVGAAAKFHLPDGVAVDSAGTVYVADTFNQRIRKILPDGTVSTLAGSGVNGFNDGAGSTAKFDFPFDVAVDSAGTVYVADQFNHRIRKILPNGTVSTLAGSGTAGFADGAGATAKFNYPKGVAVDSTGTVYVADEFNHRIRKILPDGTVSTLAGSGTQGFADGDGAAAKFNNPRGVTVDSAGTVYVADTNNYRIRMILPDGTVSTLAGTGAAGFADGVFANEVGGAAKFHVTKGVAVDIRHTPLYVIIGAKFNHPIGVAVDSAGTVYVADQDNQRIRKITIQSQHSDFNGDGQSDILWRHASTGQNALWYLNGTALGGGSALFSPVADGNWKIAGIGDFDRDGRSDILWRHATTGQNAIWLMNGTSVMAGTALIATVPDLNWKVAAVDDYNKDGRSDILWRHATTGQNAIWFMNGATVLPGSAYIPSATDLNWQIQQ